MAFNKDEAGRFFEIGMSVGILYPRHIGEVEAVIKETQVVLNIAPHSNSSGFVCTIIYQGKECTFDPAFLKPLQYVTPELKVLYGV